MLKFLYKYENIKDFKSFCATLENECFPTVKLKSGTWYHFRKLTPAYLNLQKEQFSSRIRNIFCSWATIGTENTTFW